jgi:hypothetical protein
MLFGRSAELALDYARKAQALKGSGFNPQFAWEVISRIRQLDCLYGQIVELEKQFWATRERLRGPRDSDTIWFHAILFTEFPEKLEDKLSLEESIRLLAESFYYVAHRLLVILAECAPALPGVKKLSARGIKRVRNNLIEHANAPAANKAPGRPSYNFSISTAAGIRLRSVAPAAESAGQPVGFMDEGIHSNAGELRNELEKMLRSAIEETGKK